MKIYLIKYFDLKENKIKKTWFENQKEAIEEYNKLPVDSNAELDIYETNCNMKLEMNYAISLFKRLNIIVYKKNKSWIELETDEYEYEIFKVNEFWNLNKCHKNNCDDYSFHQDTNLKKLLKRYYE